MRAAETPSFVVGVAANSVSSRPPSRDPFHIWCRWRVGPRIKSGVTAGGWASNWPLPVDLRMDPGLRRGDAAEGKAGGTPSWFDGLTMRAFGTSCPVVGVAAHSVSSRPRAGIHLAARAGGAMDLGSAPGRCWARAVSSAGRPGLAPGRYCARAVWLASTSPRRQDRAILRDRWDRVTGVSAAFIAAD